MKPKSLILLFSLSLTATISEAQQSKTQKTQAIQSEQVAAPAPAVQRKNQRISGSVTPPPANVPVRNANPAREAAPVNTSTEGVKPAPSAGGAGAKIQRVGPAKTPSKQKQPK